MGYLGGGDVALSSDGRRRSCHGQRYQRQSRQVVVRLGCWAERQAVCHVHVGHLTRQRPSSPCSPSGHPDQATRSVPSVDPNAWRPAPVVASSHGRPVTKQSSMVKHLLHGRSRDILELGANTALRQGTAPTPPCERGGGCRVRCAPELRWPQTLRVCLTQMAAGQRCAAALQQGCGWGKERTGKSE